MSRQQNLLFNVGNTLSLDLCECESASGSPYGLSCEKEGWFISDFEQAGQWVGSLIARITVFYQHINLYKQHIDLSKHGELLNVTCTRMRASPELSRMWSPLLILICKRKSMHQTCLDMSWMHMQRSEAIIFIGRKLISIFCKAITRVTWESEYRTLITTCWAACTFNH